MKREHKLAIYDTEKEDWREVQLLDQNKDGTLWYVHWVDFNRRNDQWIESSRIDWQTSKERLKEVKIYGTHARAHTHTCVYTHARTHMCVCMHVCMYACMSVFKDVPLP